MVQTFTPSKFESKVANILAAPAVMFTVNSPLTNKSPFDLEQVVEMETIVAQLIAKPMVLCLTYALPFPYKLLYIPESRRFRLRTTSWLRKIICATWHALIFWRLVIKVLPDSKETSAGVLNGIVKISYVIFIIYDLIVMESLWRMKRAKLIVHVLNEAVGLSSDLCLKFAAAPKTRVVQIAFHLCWLFCFLFTFATHGYGGIVAIMSRLSGGESNQPSIFGYSNCSENYSLNVLHEDQSMVYLCFFVLANFLNTYTWMMSYLHIGTWGLVFRQLFYLFLRKVQGLMDAGVGFDTPTEIRTFNKIGSLVEKFNEIVGLSILAGSTVAVLYISTSVEQAITGVRNLTQFSLKIHLLLSYIPIIAATLMVSEVHRKACSFGNIIKARYGNWEKCQCDRSEALCGIAIVHHDLVTSNIGFKGVGFFTITYSFVAGMLSLTITYALVAIQLFLPATGSNKETTTTC